MKKILAVSGGVDSMVMLDLMCKKFPKRELIVATFDHGTRESSKDDADFVAEACKRQGLDVRRGEAKLGEGVSEDSAREVRYGFLRNIAKRENGEIWTAHHLDDLVESVAINFVRGTGMRGLAALNASNVRRPFVDGTFGEVFDKRAILKYAAENAIVFRQDPTNTSSKYLRNRLRSKILAMPRLDKMQIYKLWQKQKELLIKIDEYIDGLIPEDLRFERAWFLELDDEVAMEILRVALIRANIMATRPQILDFLKAIREYAPGKKFNLPKDNLVQIRRSDFKLKMC